MPEFGHSTFLQALGWAILNSLWQMALLWVVYQLVFSVHKSANASQKSFSAAFFLFAGFGWFTYTLLSHWLISADTESYLISTSAFGVTANEELNTWLHSTLPFASVIYLLLLVLPLLRFTRNYRYVQVLRKYGLSKTNVEWRIFVKRIAAQMGITRSVHVWISELVTSPVTIGYIKPIILVPLAAINHLSTEQLEAVLLHELAHIKRRDYLINLLITCIQTILYFNPFVKLFIKNIEKERERSCDELVMQFQYDPHGYASALLMLEKGNHITQSMAIAASGKKHDLFNRIEHILGVEKKPLVSFNKMAGVFAGLLCIIALNAVLIVSKPESFKKSVSINNLTNPFYFFAGNENDESPAKVKIQLALQKEKAKAIASASGELQHKKEVINTAKKLVIPSIHLSNSPVKEITRSNAPYPYMYVNYTTPVYPELNKYEEEQIKETVDATKKVLEQGEWKEVEKKIADAMTEVEKEKARKVYIKEVEKFNWKKLEERLRVSYNNVNWNKVNNVLNIAIENIKLDSLQAVYTIALNTLTNVETYVAANKSQEVIHPDLSIETIRDKKQQVLNNIIKIKAIRDRKIIQL